jgi:hypothetical protein
VEAGGGGWRLEAGGWGLGAGAAWSTLSFGIVAGAAIEDIDTRAAYKNVVAVATK